MRSIFKLTVLMVFISGATQTFAQSGCEYNSAILDSVRNSYKFDNKSKGVVILIARLGKKETDKELINRRLYTIEKYLVFQGIAKENIVSAYGDKTADLGTVSIYAAGALEAEIRSKENGDIPVGICDNDEEDSRNFQLPKPIRRIN